MKTPVLSRFVSVSCATILLLAMTLLAPGSATAMPTPFPIATTSDGEVAWGSPAFDGTNFLVCIIGDSTSPYAITAQRVSQSGTLVGSLVPAGGTGSSCSVAFDGTNYLLVWSEAAGSPPSITGRLVSAAGALVGVPFAIAAGARIDSVRILFDGTNYFVAWEEKDLQVLHGQFITKSGAKLGSVFAISTAAKGGGGHAIAFDGDRILAVFLDYSNQKDLYGQFITKSSAAAAGTLSGGDFLIDASDQLRDSTSPAIAFNGTNYLVVNTEPKVAPPACTTSDCYFIFGQIVDKSGSNVGSAITISTESNSMIFPSVASDGTNFLVAWNDVQNDTSNFGVCDSGEGTCWDVWGQYVSNAGGLMGSAFAINTDAGNQLGFVAGYGGQKYFLLKNNFDTFEGSVWDVFGMLLMPHWRSGEVDTGNGWMWTSWFGFYNTNDEPWVYHAQHGWLYPFEDGSGGVFFWYNDMQQFVWTTPTTYPFLYRFDATPSWLWYVMGSANPRSFFDYGTGTWENLP